jgi:hypothetical protein
LNTMRIVANYVLFPKTEIDKRIIKLSGLDKNYVLSGLGMKLLKNHNYKEAGQVFSRVSLNFWEVYDWEVDRNKNYYFFRTNPFRTENQENLKDSVGTPAAFCKKMSSYQDRVLRNSKDGEAWLFLAIGSYNISYYGNWWMLSRRYINTGKANYKIDRIEINFCDFREIKTNRFAVWEKLDAQDNYHNLHQTLAYCNKCIAVSKDKNIASKAAYLAAECMVHLGKYESKGKQRSRNYFYNLLKTKYSDTEFQKQVIQECATYNAYVNGVSTIISTPKEEVLVEKQEDIQPEILPQNPLPAKIILSFLALIFVGFLFKIYREK